MSQEVDWSKWYVDEEDDRGESLLQHRIITELEVSLSEWVLERGWNDVFVGGDAFFAWRPNHPQVQVSPDVYLMKKPPGEQEPGRWETWHEGVEPPRFAVEIVSGDWKKDYVDAPERYASLGCTELVIFDPARRRQGGGHYLNVYRRAPEGAFIHVYAGPGPVRAEELGAYLVVQRQAGKPRLRLARDPAGREIVPTPQERARAAEARAAEEAKLRTAADARAAEETRLRTAAEARAAEETKLRIAAEQRAVALTARLAELEGTRKPKRPRER